MTANEVIETYVAEVALLLPRRQRNDVALELRELLNESLRDQAEEAGRAPDAALAIALLQGFGRPEVVAARYRPSLHVIDPADGHAFVRYTLIGLLLIWLLGLWHHLRQATDEAGMWLQVLGRWWGGTVLPSLWWPGLLVLVFGASAWARRRGSTHAPWLPRAADRLQGGRLGNSMAVVAMLCGVFVLLEPTWVLEMFWNGRAAPAAYEALTYTQSFRQRLAPWLLLLLLLNIPLFISLIILGRWTPLLRRLETALNVLLCLALAWTVADGQVFLAASSDRATKAILMLIIVLILASLLRQTLRRVRPQPSGQT